ncbi:peptidoglycan DD-metalloendopeptidase family protein [Bacillus sp. N9]
MEEQEQALIVNGNQYRPSMGLDIADKDGKEFKVVAALSGKVATVRQDALLGNVIEIEHEKGIMTVYQSVKDMKVKVGDTVKQGDELATSSTSQFNQAVENHVHFEIRKDHVAVNPLAYFGQPIATLIEADEKAEADHDHDAEDVSESESNEEILPN